MKITLLLPFLKAFVVYSSFSYLPKIFAQCCTLTYIVLKNLFLLSFTFLFACKCSTPIICCFRLRFFQPVAAFCVCVSYSPRLCWSCMNGPWKLQMFIETLAVDVGSFRINTIFHSSCSKTLPTGMKEPQCPTRYSLPSVRRPQRIPGHDSLNAGCKNDKTQYL